MLISPDYNWLLLIFIWRKLSHLCQVHLVKWRSLYSSCYLHWYFYSLKVLHSILFKTTYIGINPLVFWPIKRYVAPSDPGVIWGQKYHLCLFALKLKFGDWNHQRCFPWLQKMQKSVEKWYKKTFLHFLALGPRMIWSIFTPYVCYLEGISTMWATPYMW